MKKMIVIYVDKALKAFPEVDRLEDERHRLKESVTH
jgi:hypothetical protein